MASLLWACMHLPLAARPASSLSPCSLPNLEDLLGTLPLIAISMIPRKDAAINTLALIRDLTAYAQEGYVEYGRFDCRTLMRDGKVAIVLDLYNMANQVASQLADGTVRAAALPAGSSGVQSTAINIGGWFIPANCKHPDEAWTLLRFLMDTDSQYAHEAYGSVPITKSVAKVFV